MAAGGRYRIGPIIGEGGMGAVFEAVDQGSGRTLALKRLRVDEERRRKRLTALFEREYHTLSRLSHPAVIEVYDYGIDGDGPFYTMELLPGDDLSSALPLPFERTCALLHGVASSLCLLHTRRLVHRDVTTRNIRVIDDGRAKLLDFGALAPMGYSGPVIGTPPFVPPEAVFSQPLDARSDLFSLGVTLYQTLTGKLPYHGRTWQDLQRSWQEDVRAVRELAPDVPADLDVLTMSLIALDRSSRPRDAGYVVERLAAIAGLPNVELPEAARSYLIAPELVAREAEMARVQGALEQAAAGSGTALLMTGPAGVGRARLLEAAALEARLVGATVLSAGTSNAGDGAFSVAQRLAEGLLQVAPEDAVAAARNEWDACSLLFAECSTEVDTASNARLVDLRQLEHRRAEVIVALRRWFLSVSAAGCLVITLNDLARVDEPSAAWLATLLQHVARHRLLVLSSLSDGAGEEVPAAARLVAESSETCPIAPFDAEETLALVRTVFGTVAHVDTMAAHIHRLSQGLPRDAMALCEHAVESGLVRYRGGGWLLPAQLPDSALPTNMAANHARVVAQLSAPARQLAQAMALSTEDSASLNDCEQRMLSDARADVQLALDELHERRVLSGDGYRHRLVHEGWRQALLADLPGDAVAALHLALAGLRREQGDNPGSVAYHLLLAGREQEALDVLMPFVRSFGDQRLDLVAKARMKPSDLGELFNIAIDAARRAGISQSDLGELQYCKMTLGLYVDASWFEGVRDEVLAGLKRDSGFLHWEQLAHVADPMERIVQALQGVKTQYDATPEHERMRSPEQAIKVLVQFVGAAIAVGAQITDWPGRRALPDLLRPFACLSPIIDAMLENAISVVELGRGDYEGYRTRTAAVLERLAAVDVASLEHVDEIRAALIYGLSSGEARMGLLEAADRLTMLDDNPRLRSNAMDLRAYISMQRGDWEGARAAKRMVEQLNMEGSAGQMFGSSNLRSQVELYALAGDLAQLKQLMPRLEQLAHSHPGWRPPYESARGDLERLRGNPAAALQAYERSMALSASLTTPLGAVVEWYSAAAGRIDALLDLERVDDAVERGQQALTLAATWTRAPAEQVRFHGIIRATALAEARQGAHDVAVARLLEVIGIRKALGTRGIYLGVLHEALAYVGLWREDAALYKEHMRLACEHFSMCDDSAFAPRGRRLIAAGRKRGHVPTSGGVSGKDFTVGGTLAAVELLARSGQQAADVAAEHMDEVLESLVAQTQASAGRIYLGGDGRVELAASLADTDFDPALLERVRERLGSTTPAAPIPEFVLEGETVTMEARPCPLETEVWTQEGGRRVLLIWLRTHRGADPTGAALLSGAERPAPPEALEQLRGVAALAHLAPSNPASTQPPGRRQAR